MSIFHVGTFNCTCSLLLTPYIGAWFAYSAVPQCYCCCASLSYDTNTLRTHLIHSNVSANLFCFFILLLPFATSAYLPVSLARFSLLSAFLPSRWNVIYFISHIIVSSCCLDTTGMLCYASDIVHAGLPARAALTAVCTHSKHYIHHCAHTNWLHFWFCFLLKLGLHYFYIFRFFEFSLAWCQCGVG